MTTTARIVVDGLWKKFRRGELNDSLRDLLPALGRRLVGKTDQRPQDVVCREFWALQDVTFEARAGEAIGVIGPNGAGKSTLLKVLNRILRPNRGCVEVKGRVAALIETTAGFHPDQTGRQNVFLQGAIMGMRQSEIARSFDAIVDFSGVGGFIDLPVKRYSSGMHARLGFAIAAHLRPDILLIDEVLAVGDAAFQQKCVNRMKAFKKEGVTIIFISHNLQAVGDLCDRALLLRSSVRSEGSVGDVITHYLETIHEVGGSRGSQIEIRDPRLESKTGRSESIAPGEPLCLEATFVAHEDLSDLIFGFLVHRFTDGLVVYDGNLQGRELGIDKLQCGEEVTLAFELNAHVTRGVYHIECHVFHEPSSRHLARMRPAAIFRVDESRTCSGVADLGLQIHVVNRCDSTL